jgi:transketolase
MDEAIITRKEVLEFCREHHLQHVTSAFSIIEILNTIYNNKKPFDEVILSKGHACGALYPLLIKLGHNPVISGHPDIQVKEGIKCTTGSLGHGLPIAIGKCLMNRNRDVIVIIGDGECQEGTIWESALLASKYKLNNLLVIVDKNEQQCLGYTNDILPLGNLRAKFRAFGFDCIELNGHNTKSLKWAMKMKCIKPRVIIANTIKGKGLKDIEGKSGYHVYLPEMSDLCD